MKKHSFYTMCNISGKATAILVEGFSDEETGLYYYKRNKYNVNTWYSICPLTGLSVAEGNTRKECVSSTIERLSKYEEFKNAPSFGAKVEQYNEAIKITSEMRKILPQD